MSLKRYISNYIFAGTTLYASVYLVEGKYNFDSLKLSALLRYPIQDFDDSNSGVQADSNVMELGLVKEFEEISGLYAKLGMVNVHGDENTIALDSTEKLNPSYKDIRFELNYLF